MSTSDFTRQEWARRLGRSRTWFLYQAGAARRWAEDALAEAARAEGHAAGLEMELRALGIDPHAPVGPRRA
ncbi:MAG TPA: hypothetical protein VF474_16415 [Phenylobacterium sp.]